MLLVEQAYAAMIFLVGSVAEVLQERVAEEHAAAERTPQPLSASRPQLVGASRPGALVRRRHGNFAEKGKLASRQVHPVRGKIELAADASAQTHSRAVTDFGVDAPVYLQELAEELRVATALCEGLNQVQR